MTRCVPGGCGGCADSECARAPIWHVLADDAGSQVVPLNDLMAHDYSDECACGPRSEPVTRADGSIGWVVVHHSLDGREGHETAPPLDGATP